MNGKIDKSGDLLIERGGVMRKQGCPYRIDLFEGVHFDYRLCGDWCPLFVEPSFHKADDVVDFYNVEIALCRIIHNVPAADFEDER